METTLIPREFVLAQSGKNVILKDLNPILSIDEIKEMHSMKYPELLNCQTINHGIVDDKIKIEFKTIAGTKG